MAVEIRNLCKAFGAHKVLENFCATLPESGVVEVCGRSGAGKTTLFRILLGLETADSGEIAGLEGWRLGAVFQEDRLLPHRSAVDNVRFVCGASEAEILSHLEQVGLGAQAGQRVCDYSGGMRRRAAIVRAVLYPCRALLLDEPFKGLDEETRAQVVAYLKKYCAGRLVLLATHDEDEARAMGAIARLQIGGETNEPRGNDRGVS